MRRAADRFFDGRGKNLTVIPRNEFFVNLCDTVLTQQYAYDKMELQRKYGNH